MKPGLDCTAYTGSVNYDFKSIGELECWSNVFTIEEAE